jgi:hypothetical protein
MTGEATDLAIDSGFCMAVGRSFALRVRGSRAIHLYPWSVIW